MITYRRCDKCGNLFEGENGRKPDNLYEVKVSRMETKTVPRPYGERTERKKVCILTVQICSECVQAFTGKEN